MVIKKEVLLDISTFLARRWSNKTDIDLFVIIDKYPHSRLANTTSKNSKIFAGEKPDKNSRDQITLPDLDYYYGNEFQKYRQWRVSLWIESMRIANSTEIMNNDYAFGFILNTLETKRIEELGLRMWKGMINELLFFDGFYLLNRPLLNNLKGKEKIVEGFSQLFLTGFLRGELYSGEYERVRRAVEYSNKLIKEAIESNHDTIWIKKRIPDIMKMLQIDSLLSIPVLSIRNKAGISLTESEAFKQIEKTVKLKGVQNIEKKVREIIEASDLEKEFNILVKETKKSENKGYENAESFNIFTPEELSIDESRLYNHDLIKRVKNVFREWKPSWKEIHDKTGEEIDIDNYIEGFSKTFITDRRISIRSKVAILLDHSSSIQDVEDEYKQATIALCEGLQYLGIKFAVYAFNTEQRQVRCWLIKHYNTRWSYICAKRLAQIKASGGTPLAEIYKIMQPALNIFKPDYFITLTDGEPSDYDAVKMIVASFRKMNIYMLALGFGKNIDDAINIGHNLSYLNYDKTVSVSRLQDIPKKVIHLLK